MTDDLFKSHFEGISGIVPATSITIGENLKIAIIGKPKTGKSWFAATAPPPVLVYDFDDRAESLSGKENIQVKTLVDKQQTSPTAFKAIESDLSILKDRKAKGKPIPKSFVFDSLTFMIKAIENELFTQGVAYRSIKLSTTSTVRIRRDWDGVNGVDQALLYLITEFSDLGNVIFVAHEKPEKNIVESTKDNTVYTNKVTLHPQYSAKILTKFNHVFRMQITPGSLKYEVTCKPTNDFDASTSFMVDQKENPSLVGLIQKHNERPAQQQQRTKLQLQA